MQGLKLIMLLLLLATAFISRADECTELGVKEHDKKYQGYGITATGNYCITDGVSVNEQYELNHGFGRIYKRPTAIGINASDLKVDLQQHTMTSKASNAINALAIHIVRHQNNVLIENGSIRVIGRQAVGVMHNASGVPHIKVLDEKKEVMSCRLSYPDCEEVSYLNSIDKLPPKYQDAHITIDNMNIFATFRGVQLSDNHNVIRNSVIEVDDNTAIYLMGQYPIIENNTIIIHRSKNGDTETQKKYNIKIKDGAIKLRDAKGGIIRNNKIIYKGGWFSWDKAPAAINLLDSKDVVIEGNTIQGFEKLVRENGDTSFTEKGNVIK